MPSLSALSDKPRKTIADLDKKYGVPPSSRKAFDPDAIRAEVENAKKKGLIVAPGAARSIDKTGLDAATLGSIRTMWMDITPAMAKQWLDNNFANRRLDDDTVKAYARDMSNNTWPMTHQGVAFNDKDEMIDGQHRLEGIVLSKKTIRMMVTFGLPTKIEGSEMTVMDAVDRGRPRSVADQLRIQHKMPNGGLIAQVCASMGGLCFGLRTKRLSVGQTLDIYREFQGAIDWVIAHKSKENGVRGAGVLTAFAFALAIDGEFYARHDTSPVAKMYERLVDGTDLKKDMPISHLRTFLTSPEAVFLSRSTNRGVAELVLQAILLEGKGKTISMLETSLDGFEYFKGKQKDRVAKVAALFALPTLKQ